MIAIAILSITFGACKEKEPKTISVEHVTLDKTNASLYVGDTLILRATVGPFNATNKTVNWSSNDATIATVDNNIVTAKKTGKTTITVTTQDGNKTATCDIAVIMPGFPDYYCNGNLPGWGASLGTVEFASNNIWTVGTQIWSDAVTTSNCNKTTFDGGNIYGMNFNADCRSNPGYQGDLYSWCAVIRFQNELCPVPWRVPTQQDFIDLDMALGGSGSPRIEDISFVTKYVENSWGGVFGGACIESGKLGNQGVFGYYWSQTEHRSLSGAHLLSYSINGSINPGSGGYIKGEGYMLRCVQNKSEF